MFGKKLKVNHGIQHKHNITAGALKYQKETLFKAKMYLCTCIFGIYVVILQMIYYVLIFIRALLQGHFY